jgi:hypothetical protein
MANHTRRNVAFLEHLRRKGQMLDRASRARIQAEFARPPPKPSRNSLTLPKNPEDSG